jgi:hypothetical protein
MAALKGGALFGVFPLPSEYLEGIIFFIFSQYNFVRVLYPRPLNIFLAPFLFPLAIETGWFMHRGGCLNPTACVGEAVSNPPPVPVRLSQTHRLCR